MYGLLRISKKRINGNVFEERTKPPKISPF